MEVIDKKSYTLYPLTSYTAGANRRNLYEEVPSILKAHVESTIPFPDQEFEVMQSEKFNVYELDETPPEQELLFDTKEELIAKLEEWGFEWKDFAEKICYFPYNATENVPTSGKFAKGWVKDISPVWGAWDNLGIGKSWRATSGTNITLTMDDQYYGKVNELIPYPMQIVNSLRNIEIIKPTINKFALSNKPLEETKHIWVGDFLLKTDATTPGPEDVFTSYLTAATAPEFGSSRTGTGQGNASAGYNTGITADAPYRGRSGFAIPILFYVNNPAITNVNKIYGLIYFGYVQREYEGETSQQKYFIMTKNFSFSVSTYEWYYMANSTNYANINAASAKIDEFFDEAEEWTDEDIELPETDPYEQIQESENGGGTEATLDWTSDTLDDTTPVDPGIIAPPVSVHDYDPESPTPQKNNGGMLNVYRIDVTNESTAITTPTRLQAFLKFLYHALWNENILQSFRNSKQDVKDCIISLNYFPFYIPYNAGYDSVVFMGGEGIRPYHPEYDIWLGAPSITQRYFTVDMGTVNIPKFWDSYLDYAPYTKCSIYLPYIGTHALNINEIMGKTVGVKYYVDILTGLCVVRVSIDGKYTYQYNGNICTSLPLTGAQYNNKVSSLLQGVGGAITTAAGVITENPMMIAGGIGTMAGAAASSDQRQIYHASQLGGNYGFMAINYPFLTIESPRLAQPRHRNGITGKATCRTVKVSNLSGYNKFADIHVDQVICSDTEKELIKKALTGGFIV